MKETTSISVGSGFFLSNWLYLWTFKLIHVCRRCKPDKINIRLPSDMGAGKNGAMLEAAWKNQVNQPNPSVLRALRDAYQTHYLMLGIWKVLWGIFTWAGAYYILMKFIESMKNDQKYMWAGLFFLTSFCSSVCIHQLYGQCAREGFRIKAALTVMVYRKALVLASVKGGAGEVINIVSSDIGRVQDAVTNFHFLWTSILETIAILIITCLVLGYSALPSVGLILLLFPVQIYLGRVTSQIQEESTQITTQRVHIMSELLTAIKLIKFYAWEQPFSEKIDEIRVKEIHLLLRALKIKAFNFMLVFAMPVVTAITSLVIYSKFKKDGKTPEAVEAFTALSVYNTLRYPLLMLPQSVKSVSGALVSLKKLSDYMQQKEISTQLVDQTESDLMFEINDASFQWDQEKKPMLKNISVSLKKGQILAVIGDVGSGKSTFIASLLGQVNIVSGNLKIYGTTSYVPQEAWLLNFTLRDNILFGKDYDQDFFKKVIEVCCLERDLTLLPNRDLTEIAERGANLSGGQRQRTSLARAVYSSADLILLDDPLSAVDQAVGRHIFEECIKKHLKNKAVVMVTHQLQYLESVDLIMQLKDGQILRMGTYQELCMDLDFKKMIEEHVATEEQEDNSTVLSINSLFDETQISELLERDQLMVVRNQDHSHDVAAVIRRNELTMHSINEFQEQDIMEEIDQVEHEKLVQEDTSALSTNMENYKVFMTLANGIWVSIFIILFFMLVHLVRVGSDVWLRFWVPDSLELPDLNVYIYVYIGFVLVFTLGVFLRGYVFAFEASAKARIMHQNMFLQILNAPMAFFDATPLGRILSAFSKHLFHVDETLPDVILQGLQYLPLTIGAFAIVGVYVEYSYILILVVLMVCFLTIFWSLKAETILKQRESQTKPLVFSHLAATLEGLFSIRAYGAKQRFDLLNIEKLDCNHRPAVSLAMLRSWTALYLDIYTSFFILGAAILLCLMENQSVTGLAMSNALQILVFLQWTVRMFGEMQEQITSVGIINHYAHVKQELKQPDSKLLFTEGEIEFKNVVLKYHEFGVQVLKKVSFLIKPREKIGIVGRTGSGKSTLLVSLLRIVELTEGEILIDGFNLRNLSLKELREQIAIIPQEPVLFVGTIRSNLDPFNKCLDQDIWDALKSVDLMDTIQNLDDKLDSMVIENGKNFSLGQRQLFCIARAVLSKTKILVLDEATAAIDMQTDQLIQKALKLNFADLTVLTIAHRLNTIIECDKILVMEGGLVMEFDSPFNLLEQKSHFFNLCQQTGPASYKKLYDIASASIK